MTARLSNERITQLIEEPKKLPENFNDLLKLKPKKAHLRAELDVYGENGSKFSIILRRLRADPFDFSAILAYYIPETNVLFRLRRYNGYSHEHTNNIEGETFFEYHIHIATERYQLKGLAADKFAEPNGGRYSDLQGAIKCLIEDCNFELPPNHQKQLL